MKSPLSSEKCKNTDIGKNVKVFVHSGILVDIRDFDKKHKNRPYFQDNFFGSFKLFRLINMHLEMTFYTGDEVLKDGSFTA